MYRSVPQLHSIRTDSCESGLFPSVVPVMNSLASSPVFSSSSEDEKISFVSEYDGDTSFDFTFEPDRSISNCVSDSLCSRLNSHEILHELAGNFHRLDLSIEPCQSKPRSRTISIISHPEVDSVSRMRAISAPAKMRPILKVENDPDARKRRQLQAWTDLKNKEKWAAEIHTGAILLQVSPTYFCFVFKLPRSGLESLRLFQVDDRDNLSFGVNSYSLDSLTSMTYGPFSPSFTKSEVALRRPWLCFTLYFSRESSRVTSFLELICDNENTVCVL